MNRQVFFDDVRQTVFRGRMSQTQVEGMERLLDVWEEYYASDYDDRFLAYNMGTSYHETAHRMQPIMEMGGRRYFNKYDIHHNPRKARMLGNTEPGDGYKFRGAGDVQNTGRRNARFASEKLNEAFGLNVDFEENPELRLDPFYSAHSLFLGNIQGWWTGKKLTQYIRTKADYRNARRVVNGTDRARLIAGYAVAFEEALEKAREADAVQVVAKDNWKPPTTGKPMRESTTAYASLGSMGTAAGTAAAASGAAAETWDNVNLIFGSVPVVVLLWGGAGLITILSGYIIYERFWKSRQEGV